MAPSTILVVDKSLDVRELMYDIFQSAGYRCLLAADGLEAMDICRRERPEVVFVSLRTPLVNGLELLRYIRGKDADTAVIVMSGDWGAGLRDCYKLGAFKVLTKPVPVDELLIRVERALEWRQLQVERRSGWPSVPSRPVRAPEPGGRTGASSASTDASTS
jgi:DNA-binding NtrC family response regulator